MSIYNPGSAAVRQAFMASGPEFELSCEIISAAIVCRDLIECKSVVELQAVDDALEEVIRERLFSAFTLGVREGMTRQKAKRGQS